MGIGVLIVAVGLIYNKRDKIGKTFIRYKNKIIKAKIKNHEIKTE